MRLLITPEDLVVDTAAIVFDCRFSLADPEAGHRLYATAHIPGALYADLEKDLSSPSGAGGRHPLPDPDALAERFREWGVDNDSLLVCYDQNSGAVAGRFWWLARWLGHAEVAVLDGGLDAWLAAGLPTDTAEATPARGHFEPGLPLTRTCTAEDLGATSLKLLDAREAARYRGESEPIDPVAGHIPGAISAPFADNLADGRFKPPAVLRKHFEALGVNPDMDTACYCGSGVTATHDIIALMLAGFPEPRLYPGSWSEWITDPGRPIAAQ